MKGKVVIISAPSGAGKTTIVKYLLGIRELNLLFSVSACTRPMREGEVNGRDYYFMQVSQFKDKIDDNQFLEWEEVYKNSYYGTLKSEVERIWKLGNHVLFDVDVMGGMNLKNKFGDTALAIFINTPSLEVLKQRLEARGTESPEKIRNRVNKASLELKFIRKFDVVVFNDKLEDALSQTAKLVANFLQKPDQV
ncbi:MAG TPA: guanylate kinase [Bacteroidales bacterium]|nr:guanylate kinase [Bacteroidales bacterium]